MPERQPIHLPGQPNWQFKHFDRIFGHLDSLNDQTDSLGSQTYFLDTETYCVDCLSGCLHIILWCPINLFEYLHILPVCVDSLLGSPCFLSGFLNCLSSRRANLLCCLWFNRMSSLPFWSSILPMRLSRQSVCLSRLSVWSYGQLLFGYLVILQVLAHSV